MEGKLEEKTIRKQKTKHVPIIKNIMTVMKAMVKFNPHVIWQMPVYVFCQVAEPLFGTLITSLAIAAIIRGDAKNYVLTLLIAVAAFWGLHTVYIAIDWFQSYTSTHTRIHTFMGGFLQKTLDTDYLNVEPQEKQKLLQKACNALNSNWTGVERLMRESVAFSVKMLGMITYGTAVFTLDYRILLVTLVMFVLDILLRNHAIHYSDLHREENSEIYRKRNYLERSGLNVSTGKDIRIYQMENWFHVLFEKLTKQAVDYEKRTHLRWYFPTMSDVVCIFVRDFLAYSILIVKVLNGELDVAEFTLYLGLVAGFANWVYSISESYNEMKKASHEFDDYNTYMNLPEVFSHNGKNPYEEYMPIENVAPKIEFRDVTFAYEGSETPVLQHLNLTFRAGEKIALVGNNGAGKTTLVKLLCGLYPVTSGEILINEKSINEIGLEAYQELISVLFQDTAPMSFTIAMNVAGCSEAELDREKVVDSLKQAGLWERIEKLPEKENTYITQNLDEGGILLSGGELQKMLLARAIYKGGSILVLDEPTSALDPIAESQIYEEYNELAGAKTALFISHRLASTKFCDRILFLENGCIAEMGTHEELMRINGKYKEMFDIQSHYYKEGEGKQDEA